MTSANPAILPSHGRDNSKLTGLNPERIFKRTDKGFRFSRIFKRKLWEASYRRCAYCGDGIAEHGSSHVDHVVPRSKGGTEAVENLACTCSFCNSSKGSSDLEDLRFKIALVKSPVGGIIGPSQAMALIAAGAILPIDYLRPFFFERMARGEV